MTTNDKHTSFKTKQKANRTQESFSDGNENLSHAVWKLTETYNWIHYSKMNVPKTQIKVTKNNKSKRFYFKFLKFLFRNNWLCLIIKIIKEYLYANYNFHKKLLITRTCQSYHKKFSWRQSPSHFYDLYKNEQSLEHFWAPST